MNQTPTDAEIIEQSIEGVDTVRLTRKHLEEMVEALEKYIVDISISIDDGNAQITRPYTLRKDLIDGEAPEQNLDDHLKVWDMINDKFVELDIAGPPGWSIEHDGNKEEHDKHYLDLVSEIKQVIDDCSTNHLSREEIERVYLSTDTKKLEFNLMKGFQFCFGVDSIRQSQFTEEQLDHARTAWMDTIRESRANAFTELDELEEEAKKENPEGDDLEDIDTIKQMFRDIPQDTDLSVYKSLGELVKFWPSLLLPAPACCGEILDTLTQFDMAREAPPPDAPVEDLERALKDINDVEYLKEVLAMTEEKEKTEGLNYLNLGVFKHAVNGRIEHIQSELVKESHD